MNYIVASIGDWNEELFNQHSKELAGNWFFCNDPDSLLRLLNKVKPRYIFFPHWRWIVPETIVQSNECVCFHMTDLPYGRGGSPLQNLILRGHKDSVLTSLKMDKGVDSGPTYFKKPFQLNGSAEDIYQKVAELSWGMIAEIINSTPNPTPQKGEVVKFNRRRPEESKMPPALSVEEVYDFIRMLDAPDYPKAFIENSGYRFEFADAKLDSGELTASVNIKIKD